MLRWRASTWNATTFMANGTTLSNQTSKQLDTFIYLQILSWETRRKSVQSPVYCDVGPAIAQLLHCLHGLHPGFRSALASPSIFPFPIGVGLVVRFHYPRA